MAYLCDCCEVCETERATTTRGPFILCADCAESYDADGMADDIPVEWAVAELE